MHVPFDPPMKNSINTSKVIYYAKANRKKLNQYKIVTYGPVYLRSYITYLNKNL